MQLQQPAYEFRVSGLPPLSLAGPCRAGIEPLFGHPSKRWAHSLKLVTTFVGFEVPRPFDPLVRMLGPIMTQAGTQASARNLCQECLSQLLCGKRRHVGCPCAPRLLYHLPAPPAATLAQPGAGGVPRGPQPRGVYRSWSMGSAVARRRLCFFRGGDISRCGSLRATQARISSRAGRTTPSPLPSLLFHRRCVRSWTLA